MIDKVYNKLISLGFKETNKYDSYSNGVITIDFMTSNDGKSWVVFPHDKLIDAELLTVILEILEAKRK